jgi:hypothetical protein
VNRRTFGQFLATGTSASIVKGLKSSPQNGSSGRAEHIPSWPQAVAGIRTVDSRLARLAITTLTDASPDFLVNHAARTFYFGALIGRTQNKKFDAELLFLACALHDLGLTENYMGALPFELQGAEAARKLLSSAGLEAEKVEVVWDGIAMHPYAIGGFKRPEISLVGAGAGADVVGSGLDSLSKSQIEEVVAAFPRLGFKRQFVRSCAHVVERYPRGAGRSFMYDIGQREVPAFKPRNICDAIEQAPFDG